MSADKIQIKRGPTREEFEYYDTMEEVIASPYYHKIEYIMCRNCNLTKLPDELPKRLLGLYCENNLLTELPNFLID